MRALDLFCGGGGAAAGLMDAGYEVHGIDIDPRHSDYYPGASFRDMDALEICEDELASYDLVWASPPCQRWSRSTPIKDHHPDLIRTLRTMLSGTDQWVIENVPLAPIMPDIRLTGPMVGLPRIERLRHFEVSDWIRERLLMAWDQPPLIVPPAESWRSGRMCTITSSLSSLSHYYPRKRAGLPGRVPVSEAAKVMGIRHRMTTKQIGEAVPPPYAAEVARIISIARDREYG